VVGDHVLSCQRSGPLAASHSTLNAKRRECNSKEKTAREDGEAGKVLLENRTGEDVDTEGSGAAAAPSHSGPHFVAGIACVVRYEHAAHATMSRVDI